MHSKYGLKWNCFGNHRYYCATHLSARGRRCTQNQRRAVRACLKPSTEGGLSIRAAALKFETRRSILGDALTRVRNPHNMAKKAGRRYVFTEEEEQVVETLC